ncbi:MlaD family protein [Mycolicibacterium sp. CBM1]
MTADAENRRLTIIGVGVVLGLLGILLLVLANPFAKAPSGRISIVMDLPYVGQGVAAGTPLLMHGVPVGKVTEVSVKPGGNVHLDADLESAPNKDLTDTFSVDFRPANYFGVTGINIIPGEGGQPLRSGVVISTLPVGNFTLPAMLSQLGQVTNGVITPQLVDVVNKATSYTDGLNPLIESSLIAATTLSHVQSVSTEQLLRNAAGISVAFPSFVDNATVSANAVNSQYVTFGVSGKAALPGQDFVAEPGQPVTEQFWKDRTLVTLDVMSGSFFGALGKLLSSHSGDLGPAVNLVQTITDTIPGLVTPAGVTDMLTELRTRLEKLYAGSPDQRALQVHIVLDQIPGVQAPVNAMGGP